MEGIAKLIATLSANPGKLATALEIVVAAFKALRRMWWNITGKTSASEHPVCPHCGAVDEDWIDRQKFPIHPGHPRASVCVKCAEPYFVRAFFPITYDTYPARSEIARTVRLLAELSDVRVGAKNFSLSGRLPGAKDYGEN